MPFISTQDLIFSSQDVREVEEDVPLPIASPRRLCDIVGKQNRSRDAATRHASEAASSRPFDSTKLPQPGHSVRHVNNEAQPLDEGGDDPHVDSTTAEPPIQRKRFFTSSGGIPLTQMALYRSRKTFEEEERRRMREGIFEQSHPVTDELLASTQHNQNARMPESYAGGSGHSLRAVAKEEDGCAVARELGGPPLQAASQETDYGDLDLDSCISALDIPEDISILIQQGELWIDDLD
jgi:hypothetical protein